MGVCIDYKDTIQIIKPVVDSYGAERIGQIEDVPALFLQSTGNIHDTNQEAITSDAQAYVDPSHWFVLSQFDRLEGMLVIANPLGGGAADAWYKIVNVTVGQDKLLCNKVDNILLSLKKTTEIPYAS